MAIPKTMQAWTFTTRGPAHSVLNLTTTHPVPTPTPNSSDLLVKISHVGFNGGMVVLFHLYPHFTSAPCIPEMDFSGVVVSAPNSAASGGLKVGDQVIGTRGPADLLKANGVLCEYIVTSPSLVTLKPKTLSMAEASGLSACGVTAVQACRLAGIKKGDKVLITGGSGGLGSILVQYARSVVGAEVGKIVATCSGRNAEMVKELGADEVVDYTKHTDLSAYCMEEYGEKDGDQFDAIFDIVGDYRLHQKCSAYLKEDGVFMLLGDMNQVGDVSLMGH